MVTCPKCGTPVRSGQIHCTNCGGNIPSQVQEQVKSQQERPVAPTVNQTQTQNVKMNFCYKCGNKIADGHLFCSNCGTKVENIIQNPNTAYSGNNTNYNTGNINYNPGAVQWRQSSQMSLFQYFTKCFKHYVDFSGRARRKEYWGFYLFTMIFMVAAIILDNILDTIGIISLLWSLTIMIPTLAVTVRRLHDVGKGGGWFFIQLVPIVGSIWLLVLMCTDSDVGPNQFGLSDKYTVDR